MITARQARLRFNDKDYVEAMVAVNNAILVASPNSHNVSITIETGRYNIPLQVKYSLERVGFEVQLDHDGESSTTEIDIRW
jgi:hypothetical protein